MSGTAVVTLTIDTGGFDSALDSVVAQIEARTTSALQRGGELVKAFGVANAPIRSGHLRGSARMVVGGGWPHGEVVVGFPGPYARYQHYGPHFNPWVLRHPHGGMGMYLYLGMMQARPSVMALLRNAVTGA